MILPKYRKKGRETAVESKLIILRGNSGSGKTTVAKALQEKFGRNTMRISQDMVRRDMLKVTDGEDTKALPLLKELLRYGAAHCPVVILEGILNAEWYAPLFKLARKLFGDAICAYYYDLPFEETLKRHQTKPNCHEFGEAAMRGWWKEKDYIGTIPEQTISPDMGLEETVEMIFEAAGGAAREAGRA